MIFLQKAMVQYTIFETVLLYLLKLIHLYEHQQETKVPILAIFSSFSRKSAEVNVKDDKTLFAVTCNISTMHTENNFL